MRLFIIFIVSFLSISLFSQNIKIDLTNKSVSAQEWCFDVVATAQPGYTGNQDNWVALNIRYDVVLPSGVDFNYEGELVSNLLAGITMAASNPAGSFSGPYTDDISLNISRDPNITPELLINFPMTLGHICLPTVGGGPIATDLYDQRDLATTTGSFYVNPDAPTERKPIVSQGAFILPLFLTSFYVEKIFNKNSSLLTWSTSSEVNSDYFNIERSQDGIKWEAIGKVDAAGTSNWQNKYKFLDENLKLDKEENIFYYRLKMVDIDGIYKYSEIRSILFTNEKNKIIAFPNPTREVLNLDLSGMELSRGDISIIIFDEAGRNVLLRKNVNNSLHTIELKDLPAGNYNVVVKQNEDIYLNKIVKIK